MHLLDLLDSHPVLQHAAETLQSPSQFSISGAPSPSWASFAAALQRKLGRSLLLICPTQEAAENGLNDLRALYDEDDNAGPDVLMFPAPDRAGTEDAGDIQATQDRLAALDTLHSDKISVVVAPVSALAHPTLPPDELKHGYDQIVQGQTLPRDNFIEHLSGTGYERVEQCEAPGQFAVRGGLLDFFPPASKAAIRIELFGDEVDSIREFEIDTQRSSKKISAIRLTPPREIYFTPQQGSALGETLQILLDERVAQLDSERRWDEGEALRERIARDIERLKQGVYFGGLERYRAMLNPALPTLIEHLAPQTLVVWADPERCRTHLERLVEEDAAVREASVEDAAALPLPASPLVGYEQLRARCEPFAHLELHVAGEVDNSERADVQLPPAFGGKLDQLLEWIARHQRQNAVVVLSTRHARRVREILADGNIHHVHRLDAVNEIQPSLVLLMPQRLTSGWGVGLRMAAEVASTGEKSRSTASDADFLVSEAVSSNPKLQTINPLIVLTDAEMFGYQTLQPRLSNKGRTKRRGGEKRFGDQASPLSNLADLKPGDYVVHIAHGIARYGGTMRQEIAGAVNDYLLLEYEGADKLYVPVQQLDRVQKYLGPEASPPPLSPLKGGAWEKTKKRVREEVIAAAKKLAELYAARERASKEPIAPDTPWQREMEAAFPYEETPSQLQAIKDTKADLETTQPMDRLICGDVGFGKTEVAIRAAFKVIQDSKQVAILVPTTVLAQQHYQTFAERLAPYPARVEVLSRFRTPAEQRKVLEDVKLGAVDVLIGTHRIVQKDVEFHNLGLVVVDEEQRFGVMQKERLKELKAQVDILTLSATPIPRTLQFALGGLREISLVNDPPRGRLPVRTVVSGYKDDLVRGAIERELEREGQVYYVHNRVQSIQHVAEKLQKLVPHARIGIGHGAMAPDELETVMLDFMHGRTQILLATTIIENGLDLPNVNTLIVDKAELLGLSQMYQLRGRVGRSMRQGYAYFLSGSRGKLGKTAEDRFAALQEYSDLGAGFKIAMRDLEIRGAGDLLGLKQSGTIAAVGFEMYTDMLNEAVTKLKKLPVFKRDELPEADLPVPAFIPEDYVATERDRLNLYRKMPNIESIEAADLIREELRDRFGPLPAPVFNLIRVLKIRVHLLHARMRGISKTDAEVLIRLKPGDRFKDEDTGAVYAALSSAHDKRQLQHISLRPFEGIAINTRTLSPTQMLRMVEQICEALAAVRGARLLDGG